MKIQHTQKLFYRKYPYKISLDLARTRDSSVGNTDIPKWIYFSTIMNNIKFSLNKSNIDFKTINSTVYSADYKRFVGVRFFIFLSNQHDFDKICSEYAELVYEVTKPYLLEHIELLQSNGSIKIKSKLVRNKFRYIIHFKWHAIDHADAQAWITENFEDATKVCTNFENYNRKVYCADKESLVLLRLRFSDEIERIDIIMLKNETDVV